MVKDVFLFPSDEDTRIIRVHFEEKDGTESVKHYRLYNDNVADPEVLEDVKFGDDEKILFDNGGTASNPDANFDVFSAVENAKKYAVDNDVNVDYWTAVFDIVAQKVSNISY